MLNQSQHSCKYCQSGNSALFPSSDDHLQHSLKEGTCNMGWCKPKKPDRLQLLSEVVGIRAHRICESLDSCLPNRMPAQPEQDFLDASFYGLLMFLSAKIFSSYFFLESAQRNVSKHKDFSWGLRSASKTPARSMQVFVKLQLQTLGKTLKVEHLHVTSETNLCLSSAKNFWDITTNTWKKLLTLDHKVILSHNYMIMTITQCVLPTEDIYECIY